MCTTINRYHSTTEAAMNNHHHHNHHHHDLYYDQPASRSPGSHRHQPQTLHRQPSRQFDAYGQMPSTMYTPDDHGMRYDATRFDRMNAPTVQNGYSYELGAQTWNSNPFTANNHFPTFAATGRMKTVTRGRTGLPAVRAASGATTMWMRCGADA